VLQEGLAAPGSGCLVVCLIGAWSDLVGAWSDHACDSCECRHCCGWCVAWQTLSMYALMLKVLLLHAKMHQRSLSTDRLFCISVSRAVGIMHEITRVQQAPQRCCCQAPRRGSAFMLPYGGYAGHQVLLVHCHGTPVLYLHKQPLVLFHQPQRVMARA